MKRYNPKDIEPKWQQAWDEQSTYVADLNSSKPKYIAMSMFNYPSGAGIHIGHAMNYTISDVKARFKRQQGYESYHPIGWDAFGLPAENYAIKAGVSPQQSMATIIPGYHKQYKAMGWSNDWTKEIATHTPEYYKWTQWIFAQMYKHGLAYQDARLQWWCDKCQTVLANEQIIDGKCWRHDSADDPLVKQKEVKQWFFKITQYADELLDAIDDLDWTESVKLAQKNWIGRSKGAEIDFGLDIASDVVVLHGFTGSSQSDFHPWLKSELESRDYSVYNPDLPNTDTPNANEQANYILENHIFTESTVLVGHSYGSVGALKILEQLDRPIKKLVLAAGFAEPGFSDKTRNFEETTDWNFDFEKIKANVGEVVILRAKNDSAVPAERADFLQSKLGGTIVDFTASENHITGESEPQLLKSILDSVTVFTTRPDTLYGATYLVLAPEHEWVEGALNRKTVLENNNEVSAYVEQAKKKSELERQANQKDKTGVELKGVQAINPVNGEKIPIFIADYVLAGYGTGAIMAVPAHDERDFEFAQKFKLPIRRVVQNGTSENECSSEEGVMINSGEFNDLPSAEAREKITAKLAESGQATEKINYKMRDWSVSRQRYWGAPIPIVNCQKCGNVLIPDEQLPVVLPELDDFQPSGDGRSALARATDWLTVDCPQCGGPAERETDTLDTYICSSWYMFRYFDPANSEEIFSKDIANKWAPIDFYNGGDHATAHMLYARFVTRFFSKIGLINNPEPFKQFLFNGKVTASDGQMFSKSKGNGVDPLEIINSGYGADALRTYLMFAAPLEIWAKWDPQGVPGTHRFLSRLWNLVQEYNEAETSELTDAQIKAIRLAEHAMIKKVSNDIQESRYNTAIAGAMACVNEFHKLKVDCLSKNDTWQTALESLVMAVAPFAPHAAEELWYDLGHTDSVHIDHWPVHNEEFLKTDEITVVVQVNGKLRGNISITADADENAVLEAVRADNKVAGHLEGKEIRKTIYVPGKLVNFVV